MKPLIVEHPKVAEGRQEVARRLLEGAQRAGVTLEHACGHTAIAALAACEVQKLPFPAAVEVVAGLFEVYREALLMRASVN